jgi:hypothetical protein
MPTWELRMVDQRRPTTTVERIIGMKKKNLNAFAPLILRLSMTARTRPRGIWPKTETSTI